MRVLAQIIRWLTILNLTQPVIHLAPSPVTTLMLVSCSLFSSLKNDLKNCFSISLCRPNDHDCVVVDYDRDVLVTFPIAGLIDTNIYEVVKPARSLRFNII